MGPKVKVKTIKTADTATAFTNIFSEDGGEINIMYPKHKRLGGLLGKLIAVIRIVHKVIVDQCDGQSEEGEFYDMQNNNASEEIKSFIGEMTTMNDDLFVPYKGLDYLPEDTANAMNALISGKNLSDEPMSTAELQFRNRTKRVLTDPCIITLADTRKLLANHRSEFKKCDTAFIAKIPTITYAPLTFAPSMDFRQFFLDPIPTEEGVRTRKFIVSLLAKLYDLLVQFDETSMTPNVDITEFVNSISESIENLRKVPQLSRCGRALDRIRDSIHLLRENFAEYSKDVIKSGNSNMLFENFMSDVAKSFNGDTEIMRQFRTVMTFFKNQAATNPSMRGTPTKLINQLSEHL